mgnify:FL=1
MEKEMIELFIYYIMALEEEGTTDYSINGCVRAIENAISCIENEGIEKWNNLLEKFPENHPVLKKQENLKKLPAEEYKKMLKKAKKLMSFYSKSGTLNYDSLYLLESEKDVERLAYQIILRNKHTSEIKELLEKLIDEKSKDNEIDKKEMAVIMDELCVRYYYGDEIEKDYEEAVKGWEIIVDYINDAKYMLAISYKNGTGVKQDQVRAFQLFSEISERDIRAKYVMAQMTYKGVGIEQNYEKALELFNELKDRSPFDMNKWINFYIGEMYFYGLGIKQDKNKGLELMEKAWDNGIALNYKKIKKVLKDYFEYKNN